MTARLLLCLVLAFSCAGCALHPRMTVYIERDEAETSGPARARTTTSKTGASLTLDLPTR